MDCQLLDQLGKIVGFIQRAYPKSNRYIRAYGEVESPQDFQAVGLSCAYLAFLHHGGDIDQPEAFNWEEKWDAVLLETTRLMNLELVTSVRKGTRRKRIHAEPWVFEQEGLWTDFVDPFAQEETVQVLQILQQDLRPDDWKILQAVYLKEKSCSELAMTADFPLSVPALHKRLSRARRKAFHLLRKRKSV